MNSLVATAIRELEYSKAVWSAVRAIEKEQPFDLLEGTETGSVCAAVWGHGVPLVKPAGYNPLDYELLARHIATMKNVAPGPRKHAAMGLRGKGGDLNYSDLLSDCRGPG